MSDLPDLTRLTKPELSSLRRKLRNQFSSARAAKPPDIALLEQLVSQTKAVAAEQQKRANEPPRVNARIRGFRPSWAPKGKRPPE